MNDSNLSQQPDPPRQPSDEFVRLFMAHQDRIYSYIVTLVPNRADADDIFQEVGLVLWQKFADFKTGTQFAAWACRIAHNKVLNCRKGQARSPLNFSDEFLELVASEHLAKSDLWEDRHKALAVCLEKLADKDQQLIERCYQAASTTKQVAEELDQPVDTVYKRLARLRKQLYECIDRTINREEGR